MKVDKKYPHARVLRVIEGFHKMVNKITTNDPASINEIINDYHEFDQACGPIRKEIENKDTIEVDELESKQKYLQLIEEMRPLVEKMSNLKAFW